MRTLDWKPTASQARAAEAPPPQNRWNYALLVEDIEVDGFHCESYGVVITDRVTGETAQARHVTVSALDIACLMDVIVRGQVTPTTLADVVEDWLGQ